MDRSPNTKNTVFQVYAPTSSDSYIKYNSNGIINGNDLEFDNLIKRDSALTQNFANYRNKMDYLTTPLYENKKK